MLSPSPCLRRSPAWLNCLTGYEEKYTTSIFSHVLSVFSALSPARSPHPRPLSTFLSCPLASPPAPLDLSHLPARLTHSPSRPLSPARSPHPRPLSARGEGRMGDSVEGFPVFSTLKEGVAGGGGHLPIVWLFLLLKYLSDRRGPAALGRGEVPPSAGRGVPKPPQPGFAGAEALARGNRRRRFPHQRLLSWHITPIF